jgi:hypothetical protein
LEVEAVNGRAMTYFGGTLSLTFVVIAAISDRLGLSS